MRRFVWETVWKRSFRYEKPSPDGWMHRLQGGGWMRCLKCGGRYLQTDCPTEGRMIRRVLCPRCGIEVYHVTGLPLIVAGLALGALLLMILDPMAPVAAAMYGGPLCAVGLMRLGQRVWYWYQARRKRPGSLPFAE